MKLDEFIVISKQDILSEVGKMKDQGYRLVAITCEKEGESFELIYHFDLNYEMKNIKVTVEPKDTIPSVSKIYSAAFLIENEYQDLFGFTFPGLIIDYKGKLYLTEDGPKTPLLDEKEN
jgi:ech hydrogenase subunit D